MSVTVVRSGPDATAGSTPNRFSASGTHPPMETARRVLAARTLEDQALLRCALERGVGHRGPRDDSERHAATVDHRHTKERVCLEDVQQLVDGPHCGSARPPAGNRRPERRASGSVIVGPGVAAPAPVYGAMVMPG